jgi:hypothetical protein
MGGYGSGNRGGRPTIEDGLVLDLNKLIRDGLFRPGTWTGSIIWSEVDLAWTRSLCFPIC